MNVSEFLEPSQAVISDSSEREWEVPCEHGGTSICYRSFHDGRLYFKKSLRKEYLSDNRYRAAYRKEYCIGFILDCPYIVKYRHLTDTDDECSLYLDYIEGRSLKHLLKSNPDYFSNRKNLDRFARQVLKALHYMHVRQVLHMDLNPSNVMLSEKTGDAKVVDLGFCYSDNYQDTAGSTHGYTASELNQTNPVFDARTDIYAFGKLLEYIQDQTKSRLPRVYRTVLNKCLSEKMEDRYQSASEIIEVLSTRRYLFKTLLACLLLCNVLVLFHVYDGILYLHRLIYGYEFCDSHGLKYNILSRDSMQCSVVGYDVALDQRPDYDHGYVIIPEVSYYKKNEYEVREVAKNAFMKDSTVSLLSVLPKRIKMQEQSCAEMKNLNYVYFAGADVQFGYSAFSYSSSIISFDYPDNLKSIPANCFVECNITKLDVPEGVETIGQDAFVGCKNLVEAVLPSTVTSLGRGVFYKCTNLEEAHLPAGLTKIGMFCFMECPNLQRIYNYAPTPQPVHKLFSAGQRLTVYVPKESVELYKKSDVWKDQDIRPMECCSVHE